MLSIRRRAVAGADANMSFTAVFHVTVNAKGEVTATIQRSEIRCGAGRTA